MSSQSDENLVPVDAPPKPWSLSHFVYGMSPVMRTLSRVVAEVAPTDLPVLLTGEGGTGKYSMALEIHRLSRRRDQPFLKGNCPSPLAEFSPLHPDDGRIGGCGKGAGDAGSVFLDEVSQLDSADQTRLLRMLPDGDQALQGNFPGIRVISATARDLNEERRSGRFHQELYYRLNAISLRLPALRDRKEDIPELLDLFLTKYALLFGRSQPRLGASAMDLLLCYSWPGNVRELENIARKIVVLEDERLALSDLATSAGNTATQPALSQAAKDQERGLSLKEVSRQASRKAERDLIGKTLEHTRWNRKRTARELQISYKALLYKLKQLGLDGARDSDGSCGETP